MSVIALIQSINARAERLEEEARGLRSEASELSALFLGTPVAQPTGTGAPALALAPTPKAPPAPKEPEPTVAEIRAKAAKYGVNVDDVLPPGKKPTLQQKQDAAKRILAAKLAQEAAATPAPDLISGDSAAS